MDPVPPLLAAITDEPHDVQSQLVLADHLISLGDPRGDLIVLDCHERMTPGGLVDPEALEQYLLLAAEYTFPRARDLPDLVLPFRGTPAPVEYDVTHDSVFYRVRCRRRILTIFIAHGTNPVPSIQFPRKVLDRLKEGSVWTADEARQILSVISGAIVAGSPLRELQFPLMTQALPEYGAGAVRCYRLPLAFTGPRHISPIRYGLAARDYERWHAIWNRQREIITQSSIASGSTDKP